MSFGSTVPFVVERIVEPVEGMHRAISGRWFAVLGDVAKPVQLVHDTISGTVYSSIRLAGTAVGVGLDKTMTLRPERADAVQAFTNGLWGDRLGRRADRLGISMGVRDRKGEPVPLGRGIANAYPGATKHVVVLVHGLVNTEAVWRGTATEPGLLELLENDRSLTPISVRYNSGRKVSTNGEQLASLIADIHRDWPVPVESIALVGHSMGGLVIRSACATAQTRGDRWIDGVTDVVTLGSPHLGAPLEKLTNAVAWGLSVAKETQPLANFLNSRSRGIKDLRFGATREADWGGIHPDALMVNGFAADALPTTINHHFVAGVVTSDEAHPVGVVMGDLMVRAKSATGGRRLEPTNTMVIGRVRHANLLRNEEVIDQVMGWLTP